VVSPANYDYKEALSEPSLLGENKAEAEISFATVEIVEHDSFSQPTVTGY
jgi:hypothetical protein